MLSNLIQNKIVENFFTLLRWRNILFQNFSQFPPLFDTQDYFKCVQDGETFCIVDGKLKQSFQHSAVWEKILVSSYLRFLHYSFNSRSIKSSMGFYYSKDFNLSSIMWKIFEYFSFLEILSMPERYRMYQYYYSFSFYVLLSLPVK